MACVPIIDCSVFLPGEVYTKILVDMSIVKQLTNSSLLQGYWRSPGTVSRDTVGGAAGIWGEEVLVKSHSYICTPKVRAVSMCWAVSRISFSWGLASARAILFRELRMASLLFGT